MPYLQVVPVITVASVSVDPAAVTLCHSLLSAPAPETRENGGDLLDGDRWVDTQSFIESVLCKELELH